MSEITNNRVSIKRILVLLLLCFLFVLFIIIKFIVSSCNVEIISTKPSPDLKNVVYIYERDCGAMGAMVYNVSLLKGNHKPPRSAGNIFLCKHVDYLDAKWIETNKLLIQYVIKDEDDIYKRLTKSNDIKIEYKKLLKIPK
jgi:hypothetical protein